MNQKNIASGLPDLEELRRASRSEILRCLQLLKELEEQGIRPPDGYLFMLSMEIVRPLVEAGLTGHPASGKIAASADLLPGFNMAEEIGPPAP